MLELKNIVKDYVTPTTAVHALRDVSLQFRNSEFVAILGPSGCGKTTMLNIIGGLDRYTSGDLIIGGVSTAHFDDEHWDAYRNATIGFVFQSYNLIPHLSVLENVEMALNLSGENKKTRKQKAADALIKVGMGDELNKRPNQLSGGQMQRAAIARAIVNNPKIVLADEPTGALDSELSVQVMELLKEIAQDRLVIMVTHNDELAKQYGTRIVRFKDGCLMEDTNPYEPQENQSDKTLSSAKEEQDSIDDYAVDDSVSEQDTQENVVDAEIADTTQNAVNDVKNDILSADNANTNAKDGKNKKISNRKKKAAMEQIDDSVKENLDRLGMSVPVKRRDKKKSAFKPTAMTFLTSFSLSLKNLISKKRRTFFTAFAGSIGVVGLGLVLAISNGFDVYVGRMQTDLMAQVPIGVYEYSVSTTLMTDMMQNFAPDKSTNAFPDTDDIGIVSSTSSSGMIGDMISAMFKSVSKNDITKEFETYMRDMPEEYYSAMEILYGTRFNMVAKTLDDFGNEVYKDVSQQPSAATAASIATHAFGDHGLQAKYWQQLVGEKDFVLSNYDLIGANSAYPTDKFQIVLVINEKNQIDVGALSALGFDVYQRNGDGSVIKDGNQPRLRNDLTADDIIGMQVKLLKNNDYYTVDASNTFGSYVNPANYDDAKIEELYNDDNAVTLTVSGVLRMKRDAAMSYVGSSFCYTPELGEYLANDAYNSQAAIYQRSILEEDYDIYGNVLPKDAIISDSILDIIGGSSLALSAYLKGLGASDAPAYISIYASNYGMKESAAKYIDRWDGNIEYFDMSEMIVYNVTSIIDLVSILLIAVAAISLVVSTVMIGVITSNSVIERTREIGILRALGARKRDIRSVFISETAIIGLSSGIIGIVLTYILCPLISLIIQAVAGVGDLLHFHPLHAFILVLISFVLTVISGIIPAISASRKNVVDALRTE